MKVAYDHQVFSWQRYGGISRYIYELAENVAEDPDNEVYIVSPWYVNAYLDRSSSRIRRIGHLMPLVPRTGRIFSAVNRLLAKPLLNRLDPDLVHETYYSPKRLVGPRAKVVLTVHDMIHERFAACFPRLGTTAADKAAAVARADHVICVSENTRRDLIEILDVPPAKTSVVHLGFSLTETAVWNTPEAFRRPYLLYVGDRKGYKNFDLLLQAYALSADLQNHFDIVLFGGDTGLGWEVRRARELNFRPENLKLVHGGDARLASLYGGASLFVYPSLYEGFGIPPLEAMGFGCPVVCSHAGPLPEVVGDAAEMFAPQSPESLLAAMERVLRNAPYREDLVQKGFRRTRNFSWKRCAEQTIDVYKKVLL